MNRPARQALPILLGALLAAAAPARAQTFGIQNGDFEQGVTFWDQLSSPDWTIGWDTVVGGVPTTAISIDRPVVTA